jgi:hypothetical protein
MEAIAKDSGQIRSDRVILWLYRRPERLAIGLAPWLPDLDGGLRPSKSPNRGEQITRQR